VAFDDNYRSYREVIAASIKLLRPHVEVVTTDLEGMEQEVARFGPQLIISSRPKMTIQSPTMAWIKVPTDEPTQPAEVWLGQDRWEATEPAMEMMAQAIDGIEEYLAPTDPPIGGSDQQPGAFRKAGKKHPAHRAVSP
jgi:hypothetical protein